MKTIRDAIPGQLRVVYQSNMDDDSNVTMVISGQT